MDLNQVLIEAAKDGNMLVLKAALEKGADVNAKDGSGMTALMYAQQKGYAEIVNFLKEKGAIKIEINYKDANAYCNRGNTYYDLREYKKAIENYTKAIEINPKDVNCYYYYCNRGTAYYDLREYKKAIENYTKAIEINPKYANTYYSRGNVYRKIGKYQKAIDDCYQAGTLYLKQKNKTRVLECIDLMKTIDPSSQLINKLQDLIDQV
jgi:tetratricopeptide (TPR) repeat protein